MGKDTISMAMLNSYVKLEEGDIIPCLLLMRLFIQVLFDAQIYGKSLCVVCCLRGGVHTLWFLACLSLDNGCFELRNR